MSPQRLASILAYGLAALSLGVAAAGAAHYGGAFRGAPAVAAEPGLAEADGPMGREAAPRVRLANSGGSWPFSFLEGLLGLGPQGASRARQQDYRRTPQPAPRRTTPAPPTAGDKAGVTYRTMCVRLCDGYYWPVSFATGTEHFGRDAETCTRSCGGPVALYYYPNPGGELEEMVSLNGQPYKSLGTAFLYRAAYDASCKCRAHPWEEAAMERHKAYAAKPDKVRAAVQGSRRQR